MILENIFIGLIIIAPILFLIYFIGHYINIEYKDYTILDNMIYGAMILFAIVFAICTTCVILYTIGYLIKSL
jgi:hypothetical protein